MSNVVYLGQMQMYGADLIEFEAGDRYYVYRFSFPNQILAVRKTAAQQGAGYALNLAKETAAEWFEVRPGWPFDRRPVQRYINEERQLKLALEGV